MTWLFPLYLLGAGAIIAPILMHLRRKPPQQSMEFSSLMFLDVQTPVPVSQRRLEHWLLLLLRCLVLLLLAFMFARPLWRSAQNPAGMHGDAVTILVDQSASMQRGDLWKQALAQASKALAAIKADDRLALATFDGEVHSLWSFDEDSQGGSDRSAIIRQRLAQAKPGWGRTDLGKALQETVSTYGSGTAMTGHKKHIVLISDLQEGARLEALRGMVWPESIKVSIFSVTAPNLDNLSLALAATFAETEATTLGKTPRTAPAARVRLANMRDSKVADFQLGWEKIGGETLTGYLPPGASRVMPVPPAPEGDIARTLVLSGDAWDFDNRLFIAPQQPKPVRLFFVGDENSRNEAASPLYYLSRALQTTASIAPELLVIPTTAKTLPTGSSVAFVTGSTVPEPLRQALRTFIEQGGLCVQVLDSTSAQNAARQLSGQADLNLREGELPAGGYLMLGEVDGTHPLLRPFADDRLRDFTKLRFWKYRHLELGPEAAKAMQVAAKFDNGAPAILTKTLGKGRLVMLTSGWHPADSQLALSTKFVPLLYGWLEAAGFRNDVAESLLVGDNLPADVGATALTPAKQVLTVKADKSLIAEMIGFYTITPATGAKATVYAVNLPPEEGRVTPLDPDQLRQLGVRLGDLGPGSSLSANSDEREHVGASEDEKQQRAWLWILVGVLTVLAAETWLANRLKSSGEVQPASA